MFGKKKSKKQIIPVVDLKGVIQAGGRSSSPLGSSRNLNIDGVRDILTEAFNIAGAVAVALDVNSPGGSPAQSELIAQHIRDLAEEKHIPVYAFAQDVAASGGYWLACAADEIFAAKTSTVGSLGVVADGMGYPELAKKLGIENRTYTAGESKRRMSPLEKVKPEDEEWVKDRLTKMHGLFKEWVLERRGDKLTVPEGQDRKKYLDDNVFTGDTWFGQEAVDMGLVDGIGYLEPVLNKKYGDATCFVTLRPKRAGILSMLRSFNRSTFNIDASADKIGAEAVQAAADVMRAEITWSPYDLR